MKIDKQKIPELVSLVRRDFPDWNGFSDQRFVEEEIEYKQTIITDAQDLLSKSELQRLIDEGDFDEFVARLRKIGTHPENNLLYLKVPSTGDLSVLNQPELDEPSFCRAVFDLLYGEGPSHERFDRYMKYVMDNGLPHKWTFPTYFLFICHPETEMFVKPRSMRRFIGFMGLDDEIKWTSVPTGTTYAAIKDLCQQLKNDLREYGPRYMVDIQSLIYVTATAYKEPLLTPERREAFIELFGEFARTYPSKPEGQQHIPAYENARKEARKNYARIISAADRNEDVTDLVLLKLLPYADTSTNRQKGAWIHIAPVTTGDIRKKYENAGWTNPEDWPSISKAILGLVRRCDENPDQLAAACLEFGRLPYSKGFQTGIISPILNALRPDDFLLINNKSRCVVNYFSGTSSSHNLRHYPDSNKLARALIDEVAEDMFNFDVPDIRDADLFDMFTHWLVAIKKYFDNNSHILPVPEQIEFSEVLRNPEYTLTQCAEATGFDIDTLEGWGRAIERKGQAILYGPPGTGKTYVAEHLARHLIGGGNGFIELVQFHPAYAYEDFIQGIRPLEEDGELRYPMLPGRFLQFCLRAESCQGTCVLIIDEINRANLARAFGELMYLLEYRDRDIKLAGGGNLRVPRNVRIIGTMNTADRSIALVDHALRRRFAFLKLQPNYDALRRYHRSTGFSTKGLIDVLRRLNNQINDPHYEVGISFFLNEDLDKEIEDIWKMEIEPYLEEYFFDQSETVEDFRWEKVRSDIFS